MNEEMTAKNCEQEEKDNSQNVDLSPKSLTVCNADTSAQNPCEFLSKLNAALAEPVPKNPSVQYISETAHQLVDSMNTKRKNDSEVVEQLRSALNAQVSKSVQALEEHLYQKYQKQNAQVDQKLQELFSCLERIKASETEMENFKESLKQLYQEMLTL